MMKLLQLPLSCPRVAVCLFIVAVLSIATAALGFGLHAVLIGRTVAAVVALAIFGFTCQLVPFVGFMLVFRYSRWLALRTEGVRWITSAVLSFFLTGIFGIAVSLASWYIG